MDGHTDRWNALLYPLADFSAGDFVTEENKLQRPITPGKVNKPELVYDMHNYTPSEITSN